jgi:serine/threonine-protein phosphatase 2A regulatory subunit B
VISAVEFDSDGSYLATGDKGGRVVLFEKVSTQPVSSNRVLLSQSSSRVTTRH